MQYVSCLRLRACIFGMAAILRVAKVMGCYASDLHTPSRLHITESVEVDPQASSVENMQCHIADVEVVRPLGKRGRWRENKRARERERERETKRNRERERARAGG